MKSDDDLLNVQYLVENVKKVGLKTCKVFSQLDSTNTFLLREIHEKYLESGVCIIAESQTCGKGRRERPWVSPFAKNLYFSLLWNFTQGLEALGGVSLVVGVSVADVINDLCLAEVKLKWPNDVLIDNHKVAGILLEVRMEPQGGCQVIIGVGLNVFMDENSEIDQPWISLGDVALKPINRTLLFLAIVEKIIMNLQRFELNGFRQFIGQWNRYDAFRYREVVVYCGNNIFTGFYRDVNSLGEMMVEVDGEIKTFNAAEVSLRENDINS